MSAEPRPVLATLGPIEARPVAPLPRPAAPPPAPAPSGGAHRRSPSFAHYTSLLRRYRWPVALFILFSVLAAYSISKRLTPMFEATLTIDLDRSSATSVVGPDNSRMSSLEMDQFISTQMKLIQSDAVLRPVAKRYRLMAAETAGNPRAESAPIVLKDLKVTRPANTYLIQVTFRHPDPQVAADATNAIARSYLEHAYRTGIESVESLSSFTEGQLAELKAKMEKSSEALAKFEREFNVVDPAEKTNILSERLLQINEELSRAHADRARKEAAYNMARDGGKDAAEASSQGDHLKRLSDREAEAEQRFADVKVLYGANHPEYRRAFAQLEEIRRQKVAAQTGVVGRISAEFQEAKMREGMLQQSLAQAKAQTDAVNARSFDYQMLKQQAENDKHIYNELVRKTDETRINAGLQGNGIRIADPARASGKPVSPSIPLNCFMAFIAASLLSIGGLILLDATDNTVRDAEDIREASGLETVGRLPAVKSWRAGPTVGLDAARPVLTPVQSRAEAVVANYDEEVRMLRGSLLEPYYGRRARTLLVVSPSSGEGRSTVAANLAVAQSELGRRTLLIDGNFRQPVLHRLVFAVTPAIGLLNALAQQLDWRQVVIRRSGRPTLHLLPAGPTTDRISELVNGSFETLLAQAQLEYDLIVIDTPAYLQYAEAQDMAKFVDSVLVVARAGKTKRKDLSLLMQRLRRVRAQVSGVVLNDAEE